MAKTLCDWSKKDIEKDFAKLCELVKVSRFACRKCARSAITSKVLCKPRRLSSEESATADAAKAQSDQG